MRVISPTEGSGSLEADERLLLLGTGGPEDPEDVGDVKRLTFRPYVISHPHHGPTVVVFTHIRRLMAFTRALNAPAPFTVPTEAHSITPDDLPADGPSLVVDPDPDSFLRFVAEGEAGIRAVHGFPSRRPPPSSAD